MTNLPIDHKIRMNKALLSLEGLSLGDSFGQNFFISEREALQFISSRSVPIIQPWYYTDDTIMAISVVETLNYFGYINQDYLAKTLAHQYLKEPNRGYGSNARKILREISQGLDWKQASESAFSGMGSMGNGAAMRAAPIGAYFFDDYKRIAREARAAAEVTHSHPDAQAGAIAVATAAAFCARKVKIFSDYQVNLVEKVIEMTPESETKSRIRRVLGLSNDSGIESAIALLGNGTNLCSYDTVPITIWIASNNLNSFSDAMWQAVSVLGDRDTICAIVGSIVALVVGIDGLPQSWLNYREKLEINL